MTPNIATRLRVKYGLKNEPTQEQIAEYRNLVLKYSANKGTNLEAVGSIVASLIFPDIDTMLFASQADTLETLLNLMASEDKTKKE